MEPDAGGASTLRQTSIRFVATGIAATLTHTAVVFALANGFAWTAGRANFVAFIVATLLSYTLNSLWSFGAPMTRQNALRFAAVATVCAALAAILADLVAHAGYGLRLCENALNLSPVSRPHALIPLSMH